MTRFSGRTAPPHPGGIPNVGDFVMREAYSHEVSSAGFWPGGVGADEALFYSYAYPAPEGFAERSVEPAAASYHGNLQEFVLPYEAARTADDPDAALLAFFITPMPIQNTTGSTNGNAETPLRVVIAGSSLGGLMKEAFPTGRYHHGREAVGFGQDEGGVTVRFEGGSERRADLLVAADGTGSTCRLSVDQMAFGRVCLMGDAAFTPRPHTAASTSKAIINAAALSLMLGKDQTNIAAALEKWEAAQLRLGHQLRTHGQRLGAQSGLGHVAVKRP